jgi:hypothetical protein
MVILAEMNLSLPGRELTKPKHSGNRPDYNKRNGGGGFPASIAFKKLNFWGGSHA